MWKWISILTIASLLFCILIFRKEFAELIEDDTKQTSYDPTKTYSDAYTQTDKEHLTYAEQKLVRLLGTTHNPYIVAQALEKSPVYADIPVEDKLWLVASLQKEFEDGVKKRKVAKRAKALMRLLDPETERRKDEI